MFKGGKEKERENTQAQEREEPGLPWEPIHSTPENRENHFVRWFPVTPASSFRNSTVWLQNLLHPTPLDAWKRALSFH